MQAIAQGNAVGNWAHTRDEMLQSVGEHIETYFDKPKEPFVDALTGTSYTVDDLRRELCKALYNFTEPPFTVQRLAELSLSPSEFAKSGVYKYLFAWLQNVKVTSTVNDFDDAELMEQIGDNKENGVTLDDIPW